MVCVKYLLLQDGDGVSADSGSAGFGSTDSRAKYGGRGLSGGKSGAKQKSGTKLSANFTTPMAPKSSVRSSAYEGEGKETVKGEKSKVKKRATPPSTPTVDCATGGCVVNESSTDDQGDSGPTSCFTKESMSIEIMWCI